jgi:hypothetical protein
MLQGMVGNGLLLAAGKVSTAGAVLSRTGMWVPARTGAGVYTITLPAPGSPAGANFMSLTLNTAAGQCQIVDTSDTVKTVTTFAADGTTATDKNFSFEIWQIIPSS